MGGDDQTKNLIMAAVLSMMVIIGWSILFPRSEPPVEPPAATGTADGTVPPVAGSADGAAPVAPGAPVARAEALEGERVPIETPSVTGTLRLKGGRLDDLHLSNYRVELDRDSDTVVLLNPQGTAEAQYVDHGWSRTEGMEKIPLPDAETPWTVESGDKLTPEHPGDAGLGQRRGPDLSPHDRGR